MLGGYVKPTSNCGGLQLGWDEGIEIIEDLGQHAQARVKTGEPLRTRTVVGWTDLFGGSVQPLHAYKAKWDDRTGILLTGGNSGLRILAKGRERGDGSHLPPGWGMPVMWIENESDLRGFVE